MHRPFAVGPVLALPLAVARAVLPPVHASLSLRGSGIVYFWPDQGMFCLLLHLLMIFTTVRGRLAERSYQGDATRIPLLPTCVASCWHSQVFVLSTTEVMPLSPLCALSAVLYLADPL
jgi:hypothetical protein